MKRYPFTVALTAAVLAFAVVVYLGVKSDNRWAENCKANGGHTISHSQNTIGADGKVGFTSTTYCLNAQGGIEDIR